MENVFIDTSIFEGNNFLESKRINEILKLSEEGQIRIILPQITYLEIVNRATINVKTSISRFKKFRNETKTLRNISSIKSRFEPLEEEKCLKEFLDLFKIRLERSKCIITDYPTVNIKEVFDKYFNDEFPFSKGEKKHEFPDAFALLSIETWCKANGCKCHVFSTDKDLLQYKSEYLIIVESYEKFLDSKLRKIEIEKERKERLEDIAKLFEKEKSRLESEIKDWLYFQLGDEGIFHRLTHLDIHNVEVHECEANLSEFQIVSVTDHNIQLESKARFSSKIEIEIDDENTGWYDDEDREWHYMDTEVKIIDQQQVIPISLNAYTPIAGKQYLSIEINEINNGKDLTI